MPSLQTANSGQGVMPRHIVFLAHHFMCLNKDKNEEHNHLTPTMIYRFATSPHILVVKTSPGTIYARDMTPQARMTLSV